jgi:uncharacterized protein (TIGR01319 family)
LSKTGGDVKHIIVAGNKSARDEIEEIFAQARKKVIITSNVMPEFGKLELEQVNEKIRELFISRITEAKGIARAKELIGDVIMPTPSAVLEAAKLLAGGYTAKKGSGSCCWWTWAARRRTSIPLQKVLRPKKALFRRG